MTVIDTVSFQKSIYNLNSTPYNVRNKCYRLYGHITRGHKQ